MKSNIFKIVFIMLATVTAYADGNEKGNGPPPPPPLPAITEFGYNCKLRVLRIISYVDSAIEQERTDMNSEIFVDQKIFENQVNYVKFDLNKLNWSSEDFKNDSILADFKFSINRVGTFPSPNDIEFVMQISPNSLSNDSKITFIERKKVRLDDLQQEEIDIEKQLMEESLSAKNGDSPKYKRSFMEVNCLRKN